MLGGKLNEGADEDREVEVPVPVQVADGDVVSLAPPRNSEVPAALTANRSAVTPAFTGDQAVPFQRRRRPEAPTAHTSLA